MIRSSFRHWRAAALVIALGCSADRLAAPVAPVVGGEAALLATAAESPLVITEIMGNPNAVDDAVGEWFEVYNGGNTPIDLQGYQIRSGAGSSSEGHTIASSVVVAARSYAVLGANGNAAVNGGVAVAYAYSGIALNNSNSDWLLLRAPNGSLADSVAWVNRAVTPLPTSAPFSSGGASRAVVDINVDNAYIMGNSNWALTPSGTMYNSADRGTPGTGPGGSIVTGEAGPVATVTLSPDAASLVVGRTRTFTAAAKDADGRAATTTFTWLSTNTAAATVDQAGLVTAVGEGEARIIATSANSVADTAIVTVALTGEVASISLSTSGSGFLILEGYTKPLFFTARDADGVVISPAPKLAWSSVNPAFASVDTLGYVRAIAPGSAPIRATAPNGIFGQLTFTVIDTFTSAPSGTVYRDHVAFGVPADDTPADDLVGAKRQFSYSWNPARGGPNWVAWNLNASHFGTAPRCDCFTTDGSLPAGVPVVTDFNYRNGEFDRGHMVQSESRTRSLTENAATFLMSNILPQASENNQGPWLAFENHLNDLARTQNKEIYVIAGGIYPATPHTLKNEGRVAIPSRTWKVAIIMEGGEGLADVTALARAQVLAIDMPNANADGTEVTGIRNNPWTMYETTVDAIEAATGYDLLAALPDIFEIPLEAKDAPPVAVLAPVPSAVEGAPVTLDASGSTDADHPVSQLSYSWQFSDGTVATGVRPTKSFQDNGTYGITLTVRDPVGAFSITTGTVTITNAAPTATLNGSTSIVSGETASLTAAFTDAGIVDGPWQWTIGWGDGGAATSGSATTQQPITGTRRYLAAGSYTATFRVTDKDGASADATLTVNVGRIRLAGLVEKDINDKASNRVTFALLAGDGFDPSLVDLASVRIGTVGIGKQALDAWRVNRVDVDRDGDLDLEMDFELEQLRAAGVVTSNTTSLLLVANLTDGRQVESRAAVRVK